MHAITIHCLNDENRLYGLQLLDLMHLFSTSALFALHFYKNVVEL